MLTEGSGGLSDRATLVVSTGLAARQWEALLAAPAIASGASAWLTPAIVPYRAWAERLWLDGDPSRAVPLRAPQALALWRRVIAESAESAELIGHRGAAEWAADAWQRLCHWRIDPRAEHAGPEQRDYRAFLAWCARYRAVLAERGWIDEPALDLELATAALPSAPAEWVLADLDESAPVRRALLERAERAGIRVSRWAPPPASGRARRVRLADAADELRSAVAWASERLGAAPGTRIAIVVAGLAERHVEVERALAELPVGASAWHGGQPLAAHALLGAALTGIELTTPGASFATLSRWLRSPFFGAQEPSERGLRARLEARLRGDVRSKVPFASAYRGAGLAEWLRREAPTVAATLAAALDETGDTRRATPTRWARLWQRALGRLEWRAPDGAAGAHYWQAALDELARLTAVLGPTSPGAALSELERILDRPEATTLPVTGIHVFERIEEVGPGYAAAWLTGFTDTYWPQAVRPNPLLPRALQRAHGMPWCSPADAERRSAQSLERLLRSVPDVVASWPSRVYDYETEPSPALGSWPEIAGGELDALVIRPRSNGARPARESLVDAAPPLPGSDVPGGAGMLRGQARCPLRAFAEHRLGARELERRSQGLTPRQRGIVTHTALELLLVDQPSQSELVARRDAIAGCVERALDRLFQDARDALRPLYELERERLGAMLAKLLEVEAQRAPFDVVAIEEQREVVVAGRRLRVRIDRLDRLADGRVAIIDHKTGKQAGPKLWLRDRPRDLQVPFYAAFSPEPVAAAAIARLHGRDAAYVGIWEPDMFPTGSSRLPDGRGWAEQLELWRRQIEALVREFAAGDTRLLLDDLEDAYGSFAPLSRVAEQRALARAALPRR